MSQAPQFNARDILAIQIPGITIHRVQRTPDGRMAIQIQSKLNEADTEEALRAALQPLCPTGLWPQIDLDEDQP